jgi:hypothetical protein
MPFVWLAVYKRFSRSFRILPPLIVPMSGLTYSYPLLAWGLEVLDCALVDAMNAHSNGTDTCFMERMPMIQILWRYLNR